MLTDHYCKYLSVGVVKQNQLNRNTKTSRPRTQYHENQIDSVQIPYADIFKSFNFFF